MFEGKIAIMTNHRVTTMSMDRLVPDHHRLPVDIVGGIDEHCRMLPEELLALCQIVRRQDPETIFEIGTFMGATTLRLAANSRGTVYTLDLPPKGHPDYVPPPVDDPDLDVYPDFPGACYADTPHSARIQQLYGNSQTFDFSPYYNTIDLVFVDGSHHFDPVLRDSMNAFKMLRPGGVIVWHDYGEWAPEVVDALRTVSRRFPLVHVSGTSLAVYRENGSDNDGSRSRKEGAGAGPSSGEGNGENSAAGSQRAYARLQETLRPTCAHETDPKILSQIEAFENATPQERQSQMEGTGRPLENLERYKAIKERLDAAGITVEEAVIDRPDFDRWRSRFSELTRFYRGSGDVFIEKCLEHYLVFRHLGLSPKDTYIDVAAAESPWAGILQRNGVPSYAMDLVYPRGIHGRQIGADAGDTGLPDGFCTALSLQCAFECFMGDADIRFIKEASRILAPGGRFAIVPLYLEDQYFITTSPYVDQEKVAIDPGAKRVWREDGFREPFSRKYSPEVFLRRIYQNLPSGIRATVLYFSNLGEILRYYQGQRIYSFFMLLGRRV